MRCPTDGAELVMAERQGVEIDYCPSCRGIWLDRGELDKILERAATAAPPTMPVDVAAADPRFEPDHDPHGGYRSPAPSPGYPPEYGYPGGSGGYEHEDHRTPYGKKRKRRGSWLEDLLDFD